MSTPTPHTGPEDHDDDGQTDDSTATATMTDDDGVRRRTPAAAAAAVIVSDNEEREERLEAAEDPAAAAAAEDVVVMDDTLTSSSSPGEQGYAPAVPQSPSAATDGEGGGRTAVMMTSPAAAERTTPRCQPDAAEDTDAGHRPQEAIPLAADESAVGGDDGNGDGAGGSDSANRTEETEAEIPRPLNIPLPPPSVAIADVRATDEDGGTQISCPEPHPMTEAMATDASTATTQTGTDVYITTSAEMSQAASMDEETNAELGPGGEPRTPSAVIADESAPGDDEDRTPLSAVTDESAPGDDVGRTVPLAGTSPKAPAQPVAAGEAKGASPAHITDPNGEGGPGPSRDSSRSHHTATAAAAPMSTPVSSAVVTSPPSRSPFSPGATTPSSTAEAAGADGQQSSSSSSSSVRVAVRVRPLLPSEVGSSHCVTFPTQNKSIQLGGSANATFSFDHALDTTTTQRRVYEECVRPLVTSCLGGYNATVLAYGQTGSGKTYTILGDDDDDDDGDQEEDDDVAAKDGAADDADGRSVGVIPRALRELFERLERTKAEAAATSSATPTAASSSPSSPSSQTSSSSSPAPPFDYEVRVQFLELYGEDIRDLLYHCAPPPSSKNHGHHQTPGSRLVIRDAAGANSDEPEVVGATEHPVESAGEALDLLALGTARRVTGATAMNEVSSRSHAIMTVVVEQTTIITSGGDGGGGEVEEVETKRSKFHFVDLAGSERQKRSLAEGKRLKEGIDINKGLLVLGNVISALGDAKKRGKTFVPYRDSKLTRLLRGSLGGNHKTLMIACVSPSSLNMEESLSCLRYANRARNIQNNAVINVDEGSRLLSELRSKVSALASELLRVRGACLSHAEECSSVDAQLFDGGAFTDAMLRSLAQGATGVVSKKDGPNLWCDTKSAQIDRTRPQIRYFEEKSATPSLGLLKEEYGKRGGVKGDSEVTRTTQEGAGRNSKKCSDNTEEKEVPLQPAPKPTSLQAALLRSSEGKTESAAIKKKEKVDLPDLPSELQEKQREVGDGGSPIEQEEAEEQAELTATTKKYVPDSDSEVENDVAVGRREAESSEINADVGRHDDDVNSSFSRRQKHMNAAISELTKTISSKEELIGQLISSQEKYEEMQDFYEEKLQEMEVLLQENEVERDDLMNEMKKLEEDSQNAAVLKKSLRSKERHIAELKRKQMELQSLTKVSASNVSMIAKLRNEITDLKRKRIEIQKESASEKKAHAKEIRALKKEGQQRDRELTKWKQESTKRAIQAENAQKIAKLRLEEMGRVRTKYREAEQRLRMQTLKRGVMAKAGIDAVMVGRQDTTSSFSPASSRKRTGKKSSLDANRMRHFLDGKVSEVGKAEAAADKLAHEWEEHMNLVARKEELMSGSMDDAEVSEQLDALRVQIQFKEQRIRQLSSRIIPPTGSVKAHKKTSLSIVLDDKDFKRMCAGNSPLSIAQATAKVLFGMVVRERKRVAGLARVASSLDQKVADAEKNVVSKEAAFRSHIDEQMQERANMARQQQEQIVALMAMVREEAVSGGESDDVVEGGDQSLGDSELMHSPMKGAVSDEKRLNHVLSVAMSLSNMRIDALERELSELSDERKLMEGYKAREEEASKLLEDTQQDCESLRRELRQLRVSLRQIKKAVGADIPEKVNVQGSGGTGSARSKPADTPAQVTAIVDKALHSSEMSRLDRRFEVEDDSSGSEVGDAPAWANDIMADLQLIAEGGVPQSLLQNGAQPFSDKNDVDALSQARQSSTKHDSQKRPKKGTGNEKLQKDADVFERLTDPSNFTGIQKHCFLENDMSPTALRDGTQVLPNSTDKTEDSGNTKQQSKKTDTARQSVIDSNEPQKFKKGTGVLEGLTDSDRIAGDRTSIEGDNSEARSSRTASRTVVNYNKPSDSAVAGHKSFSPSVNDLIRQFDGELSYASGPSNSSLLRQESMAKVACKGSEVPAEEGRVVLHAKKEHSTSSAGQQNTVEGPSYNNRCQESEALSTVSTSGKECESHADFSPGAPVANKETECAADEFHAKAVKEQDTFGFEGHSQESCTANGFERHEMIGNVGETNVASIQTSTGVPNVAEILKAHENGESQERRKLFDLGSELSEEQQNTKHQENVPTKAFQRGQNLITSSAGPETGNNQTGLVEERNKRLQLSPVSSHLEDDRAGQKYEMHRREDSMHSSLRRVPPNLRKKGPNDVSMDEKSCGDSLDEKPRMSSLQSALRRLRKKKASPRSKRPEI